MSGAFGQGILGGVMGNTYEGCQKRCPYIIPIP